MNNIGTIILSEHQSSSHKDCLLCAVCFVTASDRQQNMSHLTRAYGSKTQCLLVSAVAHVVLS